MNANTYIHIHKLIIYTYIHTYCAQIESSFRIMDEYDVFMDEITRKETIQMMEGYVKAPDQQGANTYIHTYNHRGHTYICIHTYIHTNKQPCTYIHAYMQLLMP